MPAARSGMSARTRLVLLSFLMLFTELLLIRWSAAFVLYLSFFTNFVLLAAFLGVGVGFIRSGSARNLFPLAPFALAALVLVVGLFPVEQGAADGPRFTGLLGTPALPAWVMLPAVFLGTFAVMATIAEGVGRTFATFPPLEAYRLDILGSIAGIAGFTVVSFVGAPPIVWGVVSAALLLALLPGRGDWRVLASLGVVLLVLGIQSLPAFGVWSPYYRVTVDTRPNGTLGIQVNGRGHQSILGLDELQAREPYRLIPYQRAPATSLEDVLVVGAGNGNDVAIALERGAGHVDAVEIDPVLQGIGEDRHPARPYRDPRVEVHINDGRAFLHETSRRYDLILFALPDSLILVAGQAALRLESYLFTLEAMREVRDHLKPGGVFAMYNYYRPDVFDRYAQTLEQVYGHPPCVDLGRRAGGPPVHIDPQDPGGSAATKQRAVLTIGLEEESARCVRTSRPGATEQSPIVDDHPFPYLAERSVPPLYLVMIALVLLGSLALIRLAAGRLRQMTTYVDLFFMGVAFLLLETKNVVQFALLFGTTWLVNALVFAGILLSVYVAIEVAKRVRFHRPDVLYGLLLVSLAVAWLVPQESLLTLSFLPRFAAATALAFAPVFLANLIFAERFRDVGSSTVAFGANLLGAMCGGLLEYGALVTGYRALLIAVAVLYGLAYVTGRRKLDGRSVAGGETRSPARTSRV